MIAVREVDDDAEALGTNSSVGVGTAKTDAAAANTAMVLKDFIFRRYQWVQVKLF